MARLREGRANTVRGAAHFLRETIGRVRAAGATGSLTVRADSGFYGHDVVAVCRDAWASASASRSASSRGARTADRGHPGGRLDARSRTGSTAAPTWPRSPTPRSPTRKDARSRSGSSSAGSGRPRAPSSPSSRSTTTTPSSPTARASMLALEADHRRHAEIENAIRDLKYGMGLNHLPSGRFAANGAWLAVQVIAHNLARWTARLGLGRRGIVTDQDAAPAAVRPRRAAHPLGPPGDAPPAGPLALGRRVHGRPRAAPGDPAARLTGRRSPVAAPGLEEACAEPGCGQPPSPPGTSPVLVRPSLAPVRRRG